MKNRTTLKDLAKLLKVSRSTVSKALHDSPEIIENTKRRVKEVAAENNYVANPVADNMRSRRSGTIAVIVPNISNSFFARVLSG
ncbi:LacI family DNA-binding transcriptional regulator [Autumnicola musiva]|uniref:LacI family DNA-binding transcriptional regulator n=1 Tax=Autumnicola musiva TaxID=3075589 RepID=A0ABU3DAL3_9FLAO|nr:LacI family DNA-binding transcriptional regulator [Zunongwangia sp. F117]MDT0678549.1 LacI family DNA-binding transcriptional regulator [Zunongwangia sp. F117]